MVNAFDRAQRVGRQVYRGGSALAATAARAVQAGRSLANRSNGNGRSSSMPKKTIATAGKITARGAIRKRKGAKRQAVKKPSVAKRLKKVERELKSDLSYKYVKVVECKPLSCNLGKAGCSQVVGMDSGTIRNAIVNLPIGTGTAINGQTVGENTQLSIRNCWAELLVQNMTDSSCYVTMYAVKPKINTATGPQVAWEQANDDSGMTLYDGVNGDYDVTSYPTLFPDWRKQYAVIESQKVYLRPGDTGKMTATIPDFKWSDDYYDNNSFLYMKGKTFLFLCRVEGDICRDTNSHSRGSTFGSELMCKTRTNFTICYTGNVASRTWDTYDSMDTASFTGTPTAVGPNVVNVTNV
jgi:hypothetical protein